jgi:hypothetical protein
VPRFRNRRFFRGLSLQDEYILLCIYFFLPRAVVCLGHPLSKSSKVTKVVNFPGVIFPRGRTSLFLPCLLRAAFVRNRWDGLLAVLHQ